MTVRMLKLPQINEPRGDTLFAEYQSHIPFTPKRFFLISNVPAEERRGNHAHKTQHQLLICLNGSCSVVTDDGRNQKEFILNSSSTALYIPPMIWSSQYNYSKDAQLLGLASENYDPEGYFTNYEEFISRA